MESTISYLHKKFKKLQTVQEVKPVSNSNEEEKEKGQKVPILEPSSQKTSLNNENVPNQSTNQTNLSVSNTSTKSSISLDNLSQSPNPGISQDHVERLKINFDTMMYNNKTVPSNHAGSSSMSSYVVTTTLNVNPILVSSVGSSDFDKDEESERKQDIPQIGRISSGKNVCPYCNLVCAKPSVLQKHIRAHTNERPFPCDHCGFSFKTRSNLYKHCRSRTHANRVMGNKAQEVGTDMDIDAKSPLGEVPMDPETNEVVKFKMKPDQQFDNKQKLYKPRFHSAIPSTFIKENSPEEHRDDLLSRIKQNDSEFLSSHINKIIKTNNSIVHSNDNAYSLKKWTNDNFDVYNNNEYLSAQRLHLHNFNQNVDEPLNLTNKNRKRSFSEAVEPMQKSLIKELLLKNLSSSDLKCPHCKMLFQTATELELHKLKSCKGMGVSAKYLRCSSVNVASVLTQNKNAFDYIPPKQFANLKSPGPFLGNTRLVESDKNKSFSFDDGLSNFPFLGNLNQMTPLSPLAVQEKEKKQPVRLFGGAVKIAQSSSHTNTFNLDDKDNFTSDQNYSEYGEKLSENRVIKSGLQSGGTILTNKRGAFENVTTRYSSNIEIGHVENNSISFDNNLLDRRRKPPDLIIQSPESSPKSGVGVSKYTNISDFSQNAIKLLTPNLKQVSLLVPGISVPQTFVFDNNTHKSQKVLSQPLKIEVDDAGYQNVSRSYNIEQKITSKLTPHQNSLSSPQVIQNLCNPMQLLYNGKVVRYVPGIPGPVMAPTDIPYEGVSNISPQKHKILPAQTKETIIDLREPDSTEMKTPTNIKNIRISNPIDEKAEPKLDSNVRIQTPERSSPMEIKSASTGEMKSPNKPPISEAKKFSRPNSLALKPSTGLLKQHHGLTPTKFNQILISPDTPRVAKKCGQQILNGNYFSKLVLKSTTRPVYCTLNKTQPYYVPHFKRLSMYSEWRQLDTKTDKLYAMAYDSRQRPSASYSVARRKAQDLIVHSSYKFNGSGLAAKEKDEKSGDDEPKPTPVSGGYECHEDYTYVRGRGRGRYVCKQCGIRCKKPSMLKKHIRTHSNDRPYTCNHCNFSFKTKGNLTKHMKSKAHTKNYSATSSSGSSTQLSGTPSSESETDDSMDSSDESTRQQEHEAAYGLLSLSQKSTNITTDTYLSIANASSNATSDRKQEISTKVMNTEEIECMSQTAYAKNKTLEQPSTIKFDSIINISVEEKENTQSNNLTLHLGQGRPLTYPYTSDFNSERSPSRSDSLKNRDHDESEDCSETKSITKFHVIQKYYPQSPKNEPNFKNPHLEAENIAPNGAIPISNNNRVIVIKQNVKIHNAVSPALSISDSLSNDSPNDLRKRKSSLDNEEDIYKVQKNDEVIDLSLSTNKHVEGVHHKPNGLVHSSNTDHFPNSNSQEGNYIMTNGIHDKTSNSSEDNTHKQTDVAFKNKYNKYLDQYPQEKLSSSVLMPATFKQTVQESTSSKFNEIDNSAMETLADIATKQVKLERNIMAKSVATEYLKLAMKHDQTQIGTSEMARFPPIAKDVNDLIVKSEGSKSCNVCFKSFSKPSQLRLHMNVHYIERPFRCESCSVSFRTKGHFQKHERSNGHHTRLLTSPALSLSEPRPFKCADCEVAFRIHGHLAKHLRSKSHIMKLECLHKIPFGLYAELERSNSLLTEINTADGDQCLESLKNLAKRVHIDPVRTNHPAEAQENYD